MRKEDKIKKELEDRILSSWKEAHVCVINDSKFRATYTGNKDLYEFLKVFSPERKYLRFKPGLAYKVPLIGYQNKNKLLEVIQYHMPQDESERGSIVYPQCETAEVLPTLFSLRNALDEYSTFVHERVLYFDSIGQKTPEREAFLNVTRPALREKYSKVFRV